MPRCQAFTRDGSDCRMPARKYSAYCVSHDPDYAALQRANARRGGRSSGLARAAPPIDLPVDALDDRESIQVILNRLFWLTASGQIPKQQRRDLIRTISLAMRNRPAPQDEDSPSPAKSGEVAGG